MFNIFKKSEIDNVMVVEPIVNLKNKTTNEIIEEIHETFYTEVDRLLASAEIANPLDTDKQDLIEKCKRLKTLGFTNTIEVKEAELEITRLDTLKRDNEIKQTLIKAINYFSFKYPNYKFITKESVEKICKKYNLVHGTIDKYIGTVPDKNLKHIEDFKVLEDDECFYSQFRSIHSINKKEYINFQTYLIGLKQRRNSFDGYGRDFYEKCSLEIAAPVKDFNMMGMEVKEYKISKIEIPDPVVLKPVIFNNQKYYLIVTAWGLEAGDEIVVNANHN